MFQPSTARFSASGNYFRVWKVAACVLWIVVMAVLTVRSGGGHRHSSAFANLQQAGLHWTQREALYTDCRGFVYSPVVAVAFAPFAHLPVAVGIVAWQLLNAAAFLGGLVALIYSVFPNPFRRYSGVAALLLIPFALGNLDVGQSNSLLAGLLMGSIAAARLERWGYAAGFVAVATALKIYPLSIGLLLFVLEPRRFGWRLLVALLVAAAAPFLFQHWSYVLGQYHAWISTRGADDRLSYPFDCAPLDGWFLLHWVGHFEFPHLFYKLFQTGCGGALGLLCVWGKRAGWTMDRLLAGVLCLGSIWMTLLGPSTEAYTYLLLTPAVVLLFLRSLVEHHSLWLKGGFVAAFGLQLFAVARSSLDPHFSPVWALAAQPVSALLFLIACLGWLLNDAYWPEANPLLPECEKR